MQRMNKAAILAAVATAALLMSASAAEARTRHVSGALAGQRGAVAGSATVTRGHGFRNRDATITGANGRQRTVEDARTWDRRAGTYSHDREVTHADGTTRTVDVDAQRTAPGQYSVERAVTGRNGETRSQSGDFSVLRTENGRSVTGDINTQNHGQIDYSREVSHENGVRSADASATFEDGTSISRASTASCGGGSCSSTGTITNRKGGETTWRHTRTRDGNDVTVERDVVFADGTTRSVDRERDGNGDGTGTITRTAVDRQGETHTQTGTYVITRGP